MTHPFSFENDLRPEDRLLLYVGKIVTGFHSIFKSFEVAGVMHSAEVDILFERRRRSWHRKMRSAFENHPEHLAYLGFLNNDLVRAKDVRDALAHGNPRLNHFSANRLVKFEIDHPEKRFRQRAYRFYLAQAKRYGQDHPQATAKVQSSGNRIEFEIPLDEIGKVSMDVIHLGFDVRSFNVQAARALGQISGSISLNTVQPRHKSKAGRPSSAARAPNA